MNEPEPHPDEPHFGLSAGADRGIRRPMADLAALEKDLDEIEHRNSGSNPAPELTVASVDADAIWANYRKGKGTPTSASTLTAAESSTTVDRGEIERRLKR